MPDRPFGSDSLEVPIYLAKGNETDDPGLAAWKQEHPNWMVAGNWTPAPRPAPIMPPTPDKGRTIAQPSPNASFSSLDPATISVTHVCRLTERPSKPTDMPARLDRAYPANPLPGMIPNNHTIEGYGSQVPNGKPSPDRTGDNNHRGLKSPAPTSSVMMPYPASAPETMEADHEPKQNSMRSELSSDFRRPKAGPSEAQ